MTDKMTLDDDLFRLLDEAMLKWHPDYNIYSAGSDIRALVRKYLKENHAG